jgi:hypothetical protein
LPVFTMGANVDTNPAYFDEFAISSASSTSNADTSPTHVSLTNVSSTNVSSIVGTPPPLQVSSHFVDSSLHISSTQDQNMSNFSPAHFDNNVVSEKSGDAENVSALTSRISELTRSRDDLERQLLVQAASVKQYDVYCQSLVRDTI